MSSNKNITEQETNLQNQQENFATEIFQVFQRQSRVTITGLLLVIAVLVAVNAPDNDNPNPVPIGDGFGFLVYL